MLLHELHILVGSPFNRSQSWFVVFQGFCALAAGYSALDVSMRIGRAEVGKQFLPFYEAKGKDGRHREKTVDRFKARPSRRVPYAGLPDMLLVDRFVGLRCQPPKECLPCLLQLFSAIVVLVLLHFTPFPFI